MIFRPTTCSTRCRPKANSTCSACSRAWACRSAAMDDIARLPNLVWLYRRPILDYWAEHDETLGDIIRHVLIHEIGHHFGLSDADMAGDRGARSRRLGPGPGDASLKALCRLRHAHAAWTSSPSGMARSIGCGKLCLRSQVAAGHRSPSTVSIRCRDCPTASAMPRPRRSCRIRFRNGCGRRSPTDRGATGPCCNSPIFSGCG